MPVAQWMQDRAAQLGPLVARSPGVAELCYPEAVETLFRQIGHDKKADAACWHLLFFALWHRIHLEGGSADAPVIETLERG